MNDALTFTIGRSAENHLIVNQPGVSRLHARVTFITDHVVLLEDAESTYGTFVDGRRVARTIISSESRISLGQDSAVDTQAIFRLKYKYSPAPVFSMPQSSGSLPERPDDRNSRADQPERASQKADPLDFRTEFKQLEKLYETYTVAREAIQVNSPRHQAWLRATFGLTPLISIAFGPVGIMVGVLGAAIGQIVAAEFLNPSEKLLALDKEFKRTYVCPSCTTFLGNVPFADLARRRQCRECKAKWIA